MRMVRPRLDAPQVTVAEDQPEFKPITVAIVRHPLYPGVETEHGPLNTVVMAFRPNDDDKARIAAGEDVYVSLLTYLRPQAGIICTVGAERTASIYNVGVEQAEPA
jgi:hypothetical protein